MTQDRFEAFMALVTSATRSITKLKARGMSSFDLGSTHTVCIRSLYKAKDGMTRTQLAISCELDKAQISRIISELEAKGYVSESAGATSYKKRVSLTDEGKRIAKEINRMVLDINTMVSGDISNEDIETFYRVFGSICERLKTAENYFDSDNGQNSIPKA